MSIKSKVTGSISEVSQYDSGGNITGMTLENINIVNANIGNADIQNAALTVSNLSMDVANLHIIGGSNGQVLKTDGTGNLSWGTDTASPAGANTQLQFNSNGVFGASSNLTFDGATLSTSNVFTTGGIRSRNGLLAVDTANRPMVDVNWDVNGQINSGYLTFTTIDTANGNISSSIGISAPATAAFAAAGSYSLTLPPNAGSNGQVLKTDGTGNLSWGTDTASPAGSNTQVQFNNNGVFGGSPLLQFNTAGVLTVGNATTGTLQTYSISALGQSNFNDVQLDGNLTGALPNLSISNFNVAAITLSASQSANLGSVANVKMTGGSNGQVLTTDGAGNLSFTTPSGGNGSPGGNNTQVQFNNNGAFGGSANFTYQDTGGIIGAGRPELGIGDGLALIGNSASQLIYGAGNLSMLTTAGNLSIGAPNVTIQTTNQLNLPSVANVKMSGGSNGQVLTTDGAGNLSFTTVSGSNTTPAGVNTQVQFNANGAFGASANLTFDGSNLTLGDDSNATRVLNLASGSNPFFIQNLSNANSYVAIDPTAVAIKNLVLVNSRANLGNAANIIIGGGTNGQVLTTDGAGNLSFTTVTGGGNATPAGSNTQVQFNNAGAFGASSGLTFDNTSGNLNVSGGFVNAAAVETTGRIEVGTNLNVNGLTTLGAVANVSITGGSNGQFLRTDGTGNLSFANVPATSAAGANSQIQFNANGAFGGSANLTFDGANLVAAGNVSGGNLNSNSIVRVTTSVGGQGEFQVTDGQATSFIVGVGNTGATWAGSGSLNLITSTSPGGNVGIFVAQSETARFTTTGASITGNLGVLGKVTGGANYVQPVFIQPNSTDANWAYGIDGDGATNFWLQAQFRGQNQSTRGFRVLENEGNTVVFSVNGSGVANVSGSLNVAGNLVVQGAVAELGGNANVGNITINGNITYDPVYGQFWSNIVQSATANTATPITLNNGVSDPRVVNANGVITINHGGIYQISSSFQVAKNGNGTNSSAYFWFAQNGNAIPDSAYFVTIQKSIENITTASWVVNAAPGDTFQAYWLQDDSATLDSVTANSTPGVPAVPSVIIAILPVGA